MINLAWGGLTNGQIDAGILVDVSGRGDYLEPTAAANFLRMRADLHAATGVWINPAPGSSAYRPEAIQDAFYDAYLAGTGNVAAKPVNRGGQGSNHGWARAVDITGYEGSDVRRGPSGHAYRVNGAVWDWLIAHAHEYGYSWATGDESGEAWHWESLTPPGTTTASIGATPIKTTLETLMAQADELTIYYTLDANGAQRNFVAGGGSWMPIDDRDGINGQDKINAFTARGVKAQQLDQPAWNVWNQICKSMALASRTLT